MARIVAGDEAARLSACAGDHEAASALGVDVDRVRSAVVHLLWEDCTVSEALSAAAALRAAGGAEEARAVVQAVLDQCVGLGGVPQGTQRAPGALLGDAGHCR